jgi:phage FluMu gp28-like protein
MNCRRYIGIDVGVVNDYTVLTCINDKLEVIDIDRFNQKESNLSYKQYVDRIKNFILKHDKHLYAAYFEINNKDLLFEDLISDKRLYKLEEFSTNISTKPKIIHNLMKLFEDEKILIPDNDVLVAELYAYSSKTNPITGRVQFQNQGEAHDDTVSSLAIACWCWRDANDGGTIQTF